MAPPFKKALFDIIYGEGISRESDLIDCGVESGVIERAGTWYSYKNERLGQGKDNVKKLLQEKKDLANEIDKAVRKKAGLIKSEPSEAEKSQPEQNKP